VTDANINAMPLIAWQSFKRQPGIWMLITFPAVLGQALPRFTEKWKPDLPSLIFILCGPAFLVAVFTSFASTCFSLRALDGER